jgi:PmbA protein
MKINLDAYRETFSHLPANVSAAEVCADLKEELNIAVCNGVQTAGESFSRTTLYLRASGDKTGTILTENLDEDPYVLIEKALEGAAFSQAEQAEPMNDGGHGCVITGDDSATAAQLREAACELEQVAMVLPGVATIEKCSLRKTVTARRVMNSKGMDLYLEHTGYLATLSVRVKREHGRGPVGKTEMYVSMLSQLDFQRMAKIALENANRMDGGGSLQPVSVPSGTYRALLSADVTRNIMITAWMAFAGDRIQNGTSVFKPEMEQIAAPRLCIVDDPTPPNWSVNYGLDSEGTLCRKKYVVKDGKLESPLCTKISNPDSPGGNAGRIAGLSGTTPINLITVPSCIYVENGDSTVDEMIQTMDTGIYLTYSLDVFHSINIASGEFSIPCGGVVYKDGKPVGIADQLTIAGNLRDLLKDIRAVGNDLTLEEFMFYHNYSYGGPSLLVDQLAFASKQE